MKIKSSLSISTNCSYGSFNMTEKWWRAEDIISSFSSSLSRVSALTLVISFDSWS